MGDIAKYGAVESEIGDAQGRGDCEDQRKEAEKIARVTGEIQASQCRPCSREFSEAKTDEHRRA